MVELVWDTRAQLFLSLLPEQIYGHFIVLFHTMKGYAFFIVAKVPVNSLYNFVEFFRYVNNSCFKLAIPYLTIFEFIDFIFGRAQVLSELFVELDYS